MAHKQMTVKQHVKFVDSRNHDKEDLPAFEEVLDKVAQAIHNPQPDDYKYDLI